MKLKSRSWSIIRVTHPSSLSPWRLLPPAQTECVDPWCRLSWADQNSRPKELAVVRAPLGVIPPGQGRDSAISQGPMPKAALQWEGARHGASRILPDQKVSVPVPSFLCPKVFSCQQSQPHYPDHHQLRHQHPTVHQRITLALHKPPTNPQNTPQNGWRQREFSPQTPNTTLPHHNRLITDF